MKLLLIFLFGLGLLFGAIVLNLIGNRLGFMSWYDFIENPGSASALSYLWLFVLYPLGLGLVVYILSRFIHL